MDANSQKRLFRFGPFEADERTGELRKQGRRLPLPDQPLQILLMLLGRPGELVTRREIQQRLWPNGTFVDFDHSVNTAVNKIRDALGDSAASPRFVETLARRGYRFIGPVEVTGDGPPATLKSSVSSDRAEVSAPPVLPAQHSATPKTEPGSRFAQRVLTRPEEVPQASRPLVRSLFLLLQLMYLCFYVISLARLRFVDDAMRGIVSHPVRVVILLLLTALAGIPVRLYLISAAAFGAPGLRGNFLRIFPLIFLLDELWALAPFLLAKEIGFGAALAATAALLYAPFAERSLILMGAQPDSVTGKRTDG
jgi:cholera toxin transcriptional activator